MDLEAQMTERRRRHRLFVLITMIVCHVMHFYHTLFLSCSEKIPYHTSILTGEGWVLELLSGHPDRIKTSLGVGLEVFEALVQILVEHGFTRSCHISKTPFFTQWYSEYSHPQ